MTMEAIVINSDSEDEKNSQNTETRSKPLPGCRVCKGVCNAPDTVAFLPPSTSPAYLEALYSRSKIRAPKRPMQTLVELFPVIDDVNKEFRALLGIKYTEANVMNFIQFYIRTMRTLQEQVHRYPNKCRALSRNVCRTLLLIKKISTNVIEPTPYFMQKICELLAIYMFLELRYASSYSESKAKVVERIVSNFILNLETPNLNYILRIFAYIPSVGKEAYIVSRVFQRLIPIVVSSNKNEFSDRLYVQYLIAFYHWKDAETLPNCQENVIALANAFMKPKRTLKSSAVYARHLPCYEKRENATRYFLTNMVFFNDLRNASLLDGVALLVDDTIDLSHEVDLLSTNHSEPETNHSEPEANHSEPETNHSEPETNSSELEPNSSELELNDTEQHPPVVVPKTEIVSPTVVGTVDLTEEEEETSWLINLARRAREREVNPSSIQTKPTPEVIEVDSSDDESWVIWNLNFMAINGNEPEKGTSNGDDTAVPFDLPEDSSSDVLIREAIADSKNAIRTDDTPPTERRLTFEGVLRAQVTGLPLASLATCASGSPSSSSSPVSVLENVSAIVPDGLNPKPCTSASSAVAIGGTSRGESSKACTNAMAIAAIRRVIALANSMRSASTMAASTSASEIAASTSASAASTSASAIAASTSASAIAASTSASAIAASTSASAIAASTSASAIAASTSASAIAASTSASAIAASKSASAIAASMSMGAIAASRSASTMAASTSASAIAASKSASTIGASTSASTIGASTSARTNGASTSARAMSASTSASAIAAYKSASTITNISTSKSSSSSPRACTGTNLSAGTSKSSSVTVNVNTSTGTKASTSRASVVPIEMVNENQMQTVEIEKSVNELHLETSTEMIVETESEKEARGRALVADILTNFSEATSPACSDTAAGKIAELEPEPEPEPMDHCEIGENTIDESAAAPKEAVTLNLESYTNSFSCNEENDEFLRYYETMPPLKTYLRKPPKKPETPIEKPAEPVTIEKSPNRKIDESPAEPAMAAPEVANDAEEQENHVQPEAVVEASASLALSASEKATEEDLDQGEINPSQKDSVVDGAQVLFSRKVISLREDDCLNGGQTPSYLKVPESVEVSPQGSNVVFSMQGRRLSSFPPLQVSSPHHHGMPDFDADFFSEGEESVPEKTKETPIAIPAVTTFPKTIIKHNDVEKEKPTTKRRSVWFSDKNEVREIAPRDELSEFTMQSSLVDISASINSLSVTKQQFLPSTSTSQLQHSTSTSTSHQPPAINAYKSPTATATATATSTLTASSTAASATANNSNILKKSMPSTTAPSTSTDTATLKSAQEKALLRELFPDLFVAAGKTETQIISEITDSMRTAAKSNAAHNQKKVKKSSSSSSSHGKARSSSSCINYRPNHNFSVNQNDDSRRQSVTTPTPAKQTLSEFDRYLLNLQKKRSRSNTQYTKDVKMNTSGRKSSSGDRKHQFVPVKNIKSLVDITSDVKLNKLRTRVVIDRDYEDIFRAALRRKDNSRNLPSTQQSTVAVAAKATPTTMTVAAKTAALDTATTMNIVPESATLPPMKPTKEDQQPELPVEKVNLTEYVVRAPEKQTNPTEPLIRVPSRSETKSLGDILTDIVEQEVIAQVVKDKVLPLNYQQLGREKALSPVTALPQLSKETAIPIDLPQPYALSKDVEEKTEPPAPVLLLDKSLNEDDSLSEKSDIPSPQFEPINLSVSLAEQISEAQLPSSPTAQSDEEKAPELQQPETAPNETEVKPPVETDPSKSELKPIKLEDVESDMPPTELNVPNDCNRTRVQSVNTPDISCPTVSENDTTAKALEDELKESPRTPVRLEVIEEVEVHTEPPLEASDSESTSENVEETLQSGDGLNSVVQYAEEEEEEDDDERSTSNEVAEEAKEIKIRLKRYEQQRGEKYMIVSNSGDRISPSKKKRPNKMLPDEQEDIVRTKKNNGNESNAKKEVVLKKIFERYRGDEMENDCNHHRRNSNNGSGVPLGHNIESISTPPPTPPSRSPPPALESNSQPRGEQNNNHGRRPKSSHTLSSYLTESSDMIQEFRKHVNMPTEVEIDSNSLVFFYEYLIERKDDRAMEEINKIMPLLNDSSKAMSAHRRRFDSCSLPSKRRARKHSSSEINDESTSGVSKVKMRRKTICSDSHYMLSSPDFDDDICSSPKAADSPTAEVMRLHSSNRVGLFKKFSKVSETVTKPTEDDVNDERPQDDLDIESSHSDTNQNLTPGCSSQSLTSSSPSLTATATPEMSSSPSPSLPSSIPHKSVIPSKTVKSGDSCSDVERSRKQSRRAKCESPPDIARTMVVSRTYSKSNMVQHVFVPPEIEKCIEEEASAVVESTKPTGSKQKAPYSTAPPPTPPTTASSESSSSSSSSSAGGSGAAAAIASTSSAACSSKKQTTSRSNAGSCSKTRKIRRIVDFPDTDDEDDNDDSNDEDFNYEEEIKELNRSIANSGGKRSRKKSQARKRKNKNSNRS